MFLAVVLAGCGGEKTVSISGTVTLDGQPIEDCQVVFQPKGTKGGEVGLFDSVGLTDAAGKYTLTMLGARKKKGAVVGDYFVRFGWVDPNPAEEGDQPPNPPPYKLPGEVVEFTVPPRGTSSADFQLTSNKK